MWLNRSAQPSFALIHMPSSICYSLPHSALQVWVIVKLQYYINTIILLKYFIRSYISIKIVDFESCDSLFSWPTFPAWKLQGSDTPSTRIEELVVMKTDFCVATLHICLGQQVSLDHTVNYTADCQLACMLCACVKRNEVSMLVGSGRLPSICLMYTGTLVGRRFHGCYWRGWKGAVGGLS